MFQTFKHDVQVFKTRKKKGRKMERMEAFIECVS